MSEEDAARKAYRFFNNTLLEWPDLPPMYDCQSTHPSDSSVTGLRDDFSEFISRALHLLKMSSPTIPSSAE